MSFTIVEGYLLSRNDFEIFDEIISFIASSGNIFTCIAKGTRKISSKNSRNLVFGDLLEFEFFSSRSIDKVSKLMRVKIKQKNNNISWNNYALIYLNEVILKLKISGKKLFEYYKHLLMEISNFNNEYDMIVTALIFLIQYSGIKIILNKCAICGSKKINNFSNIANGFVCPKCDNSYFKIELDVILFLYNASINNLKMNNEFKLESKKIALKILLNYIYEKNGVNLYPLVVNF